MEVSIMKRRDFLANSTALGLLASFPACVKSVSKTEDNKTDSKSGNASPTKAASNPLTPPDRGPIPIAFVVSNGTVMIDLAGPWEVFNTVMVPSRGKSMEDQMPFRTYTVAETLKPIHLSGGLKFVPEYTFANAPAPKIVVIPAQSGVSKAMLEWIKTATKSTDVTMSVCTGAFILGETGLLTGKSATTHHGSYKTLAMQFPNIQVKRGARFVEDGNLATSGGLSSGIDLALRVVERYFGTKVAATTAYELEYQGQGWKDPNSNAIYLQSVASSDGHPMCPICGMEVDPATAPKSDYKGKSYYFCSNGHKAQFDAAPDKWI
jgi:YHS domain-containing protein/putative intracellular protease/amidase